MQKLTLADMAKVLKVTEIELSDRVSAAVTGEPGTPMAVAQVMSRQQHCFLTGREVARLLVAIAGQRAAELLEEVRNEVPAPASGF